jgi:hypothetical protein
MRATVMFGAGDVRIETVPDARLIEPTDAFVAVSRAAICGSDLWPYKTMEHSETGRRMGHEFIGIVEAVGADVRTVKVGDVVVAPFLYSDGTCVFCREGLHTSCLHGGRYGWDGVDGGQGEAVRVPQADGTLVVLRRADDRVDERRAEQDQSSRRTADRVRKTRRHAAEAGDDLGRPPRQQPLRPVRQRAHRRLVPWHPGPPRRTHSRRRRRQRRSPRRDDINDEIDAAYRTKYHRYAASIIDTIVSPQARAATLRLAPRS